MDRLISNDEAYSWRMIQYSFESIFERAPLDANPPLSYFVQKIWSLAFGDSIVGLRALSLLVFVASIAAAMCCVNLRLASEHSRGARVTRILVAAALLFHPLLLHQAVTARMYSIGILLTGVTSYLLLRSLATKGSPFGWLLAYGIFVATFAWTHYFSFFAIAGQAAYASVRLLNLSFRGEGSRAGRWLISACPGAALSLLLFLPCLPVFIAQRGDVQDGFWVRDTSLGLFQATILPSFCGMSGWHGYGWCVVGVLFGFGVRNLWLDWSSGIWITQTVVTCFLAVAYGLVTGSSIVCDRYFSFAVYSWWVYIAAFSGQIASPLIRLLALVGICGLLLPGLVDEIYGWPSSRAYEQAAEYLRGRYMRGDICWAESIPESNRLRYYLARAGMREVEVRCRRELMVVNGHQVHVGSICAEELFSGDVPDGQRIWRCYPGRYLPDSAMDESCECLRVTFEAEGRSYYTLVLFQHLK